MLNLIAGLFIVGLAIWAISKLGAKDLTDVNGDKINALDFGLSEDNGLMTDWQGFVKNKKG